MRLHLSARTHAFYRGLFRKKDEVEARELYDRVHALYAEYGLNDEDRRSALCLDIASEVVLELGFDTEHPLAARLGVFVCRLLDYEGVFERPQINWAEPRSVSEWWLVKDALWQEKHWMEDVEAYVGALESNLVDLLQPLADRLPKTSPVTPKGRALVLPCAVIDLEGGLAQLIEDQLGLVLASNSETGALFRRLSGQLYANAERASSHHPLQPERTQKSFTLPTKAAGTSSRDLIETYLGKTPLADLLSAPGELVIPETTRFEHCHIIGGSGHGKSQTLQYLIAHDLPAVAAGERSVVVLDSQGDLIRNISGLKEFAPGGPLHDCLVLIDPSDVEYPVSLNLFDVSLERLNTYAPLERERLINSILELYDFVLGSLLSAEMTQKQNVIFRYVARLMLHIPDATIHTLRDLMEPGSEIEFAEQIATLEGSARRFFETEFASREFAQTKLQVKRRLWGILENQTFERMFSHPRSKLDLFSEINSGKVILINTAKDLLKEQGSQIFGRFFIALIAQAAQERATLPENKRLPTFVYVDEAADYFDRNIGIILAQARKYNVGMVLAHQYLGQLEPKLQDAFAANTSIKLAGGVSAKDARTLAAMMRSNPAEIEGQPKGSFATYVRSVTEQAISVAIPFGHLEKKPRMTDDDATAIRDKMRSLYALHHKASGEDTTEADPSAETEEAEPTTPVDHVDITPGDEW